MERVLPIFEAKWVLDRAVQTWEMGVDKKWTLWELNPRPRALTACEARALPTELKAHEGSLPYTNT